MGMYDVGDELGSLSIGWNPFRRHKKRGRGRKRHALDHARNQLPQRTDLRLQPLGMGSSAFTAATPTILTLQQFPQRPFDGKRIVIDVTRTATATGLLTLTRLDIGSDNQLVSSGALSVGAFQAQAFDVNLELARAWPGIQITMQFNVSVLPAGADRIDFSATIFGVALPLDT